MTDFIVPVFHMPQKTTQDPVNTSTYTASMQTILSSLLDKEIRTRICTIHAN